ncbi:hypothetical protein [Streptosporangium subroseum]|uniref:hypothetical protein n=1 Tax=Streptosporangium subroseum TaxID=106412 RepID=UPI00308FF7ED|nr:hypothetical protein OHB15_00160 [Streptosporangium subroseum]
MPALGGDSQERYLLAYVAATGVGAVVGGSINAVLWPPLYQRRPYGAARRLNREAAALLKNVAGGLREHCDLSDLPDWQRHADRLNAHLAQATSAIADGAESRRYNLRRISRPAPSDHAPLLAAMGQIGVHIHGIVRALGAPTAVSEMQPERRNL